MRAGGESLVKFKLVPEIAPIEETALTEPASAKKAGLEMPAN